jgi:dihydroorotase
MEYLIMLIIIGFLYLIFKPKQKVEHKSTLQKQDEIYEEYKAKMDIYLQEYKNNKELYEQKKIALLKSYANELNRNLFFDVEDTRKLIQRLIDGR